MPHIWRSLKDSSGYSDQYPVDTNLITHKRPTSQYTTISDQPQHFFRPPVVCKFSEQEFCDSPSSLVTRQPVQGWPRPWLFHGLRSGMKFILWRPEPIEPKASAPLNLLGSPWRGIEPVASTVQSSATAFITFLNHHVTRLCLASDPRETTFTQWH